MRQVRCALYTRKSSEEGLEQDFNSLHAQREACAAYVLSQASEGWSALPEPYDDGGVSGGTLERPALQRLLADIAAGKVDIVVVYKLDRLSRSLFDFAKLVELFDKGNVSFVSVTQSFNTTTSMGRLTLNMLLSFAQFEREVTAERIRDKLAASKAKGMWMGGVAPLGYAPDGRSLRIIPEQAALIRRIYERYFALGNVRLLLQELNASGARLPIRTLKSGKVIGGREFLPGPIYAILRSPIYAGDIGHRDKVYPGLHEAIIERELWDAVQTKITEQRQGERRGQRAATPSPLAGKVFDGDGNALIASHAAKGSRRYRYYISKPQVKAVLRVPALELEKAAASCIAAALDEPFAVLAQLGEKPSAASLARLFQRTEALATRLRSHEKQIVRDLVARVEIADHELRVQCDAAALAAEIWPSAMVEPAKVIALTADTRLKRSGRAVRLVHSSGSALTASPSPSVIKLVLKARRWWQILRTEPITIAALARREDVTPSYMCRIVRLAFLAPAVVDAIIAGTTRSGVSGGVIAQSGTIEPNWQDQIARLLPPSGRVLRTGATAGYGLRVVSAHVSARG